MKLKRLFILAALVLTLSIPFSASAAGAPVSLVVSNVSFTQCSGAMIEGRLSVQAYDASGTLTNDVTAIQTTLYINHSNGPVAPQSWSFLASTVYQFAFSSGSGAAQSVSLQVVADSTGATSQTVVVGCDGSITFLGAAGKDTRLNTFHCDLISALYATSNGIEVWDIQPDSKGVYKGSYTKADIAAFVDAAPEVNTRVGSIGETTGEVLTSGEFQINIGPDAEGKICSVILDGIPPKRVYFRTPAG